MNSRHLVLVSLLCWASPAWAATTTFMEAGTDATQALTFYPSTSGTVASATNRALTGFRSLELSTGGLGITATATRTGVLADAGRRISVWFQTDALPNASNFAFELAQSNGSTLVYHLDMNPNGTLTSTPVGATAATGVTVLRVNTWYRICISYYITNTTTFAFKVYVNGVLDHTASSGTLTNTSTNALILRMGSFAGAGRNGWFDNIYVDTGASSSSQTDTGDIRVTAKRPNANGTTNGFTTQIGSGGSSYGTGHSPQVNEQPLSATNGWSINDVAGSAITEEYNIENTQTGDVDVRGATIVDVAGWVYTSALAAETGNLIVDNVSSNISITTSNALFEAFSGKTTYPAGTGTDVGEISATTITTISLYEAGILIAYKPPTLLWTD